MLMQQCKGQSDKDALAGIKDAEPYLVRIGRSVSSGSEPSQDYQLAEVYDLQSTRLGMPGHKDRVSSRIPTDKRGVYVQPTVVFASIVDSTCPAVCHSALLFNARPNAKPPTESFSLVQIKRDDTVINAVAMIHRYLVISRETKSEYRATYFPVAPESFEDIERCNKEETIAMDWQQDEALPANTTTFNYKDYELRPEEREKVMKAVTSHAKGRPRPCNASIRTDDTQGIDVKSATVTFSSGRRSTKRRGATTETSRSKRLPSADTLPSEARATLKPPHWAYSDESHSYRERVSDQFYQFIPRNNASHGLMMFGQLTPVQSEIGEHPRQVFLCASRLPISV